MYVAMTIKKLLQMSESDRTYYLESLAQAQGLETAPLQRNESQILAKMLSGITGYEPEMLAKTLWGHYLKPPITLYRLLKQFHPHLLHKDKTKLRVLYLGSDKDEVIDEGRWFSMAWEKLGLSHQDLQITAVGPELADSHAWEGSAWSNRVAHISPIVTVIPGTLDDAFSTPYGCIDWEEYFDLVVMHHPGFVSNVFNWMTDDAFQDLAGFAQIPIVGTSFDAADFAYDFNGLCIAGRFFDKAYWNSAAHINPCAIDNKHLTRIQWGTVMWSATVDPDAGENTVTTIQKNAIEWQHTYHPMHKMLGPYQEYLVWLYTCPMQLDDFHQFIYVSDDIKIHCATGHVHAYGDLFAATPISKQLGSAPTLEHRLQLFTPLLDEIFQHLDKAKVAKYMKHHSARMHE